MDRKIKLFEEFAYSTIEWTDTDGKIYTISYVIENDDVRIVMIRDEQGHDVMHKLDMLIDDQMALKDMIKEKTNKLITDTNPNPGAANITNANATRNRH